MKLNLPDGDFKAYLFDCDGTIADSMPLHFVAWKKVLAEWNCSFDEKQFYSLGGMPTDQIVELLNRQNGLQMSPKLVAGRKELVYFKMLPELQGVPEVLEHIHAQFGKIPFAVVSGGTRESVTASLTSLKLMDRFAAMVCAGDYTRSKPDPEPYRMAAEKLGVAPKDCLVFEDTDMGIESAVAAGMAWVKVPPPWERQAGPDQQAGRRG